MTENVPDWLNDDFLKACIQSDEGNSDEEIIVTSHSIEPAVPPGNNYGSHMFRVKVQYRKREEEHSISLIIKAPLTGVFPKELGDLLNGIYEREPKYYSSFINETYKLCQHDIVPKYYKSSHPFGVVLEDLKASGYVMADKNNLLNFEHCQLYIKASAKLHALSIKVYKKHPEIIEFLGMKNPITDNPDIMKTIVSRGLMCMAVYLEDKPDYKEYLDIINEAIKNDNLWCIFQALVENENTSENPLRALVQGDPWCTNMMFKYDSSGKVCGVKLLDFQNLRFTTPLYELVSFVWVSANAEVRETKLNDLYQLYCDSLNKHLAEFGCSEKLTIENLKAGVAQLSPLVVSTLCTLFPFCLAEVAPSNNDIFGEMASGVPIKESKFYKLFQGPNFIKFFPQVLNQAGKEGAFKHLKEQMQQRNLEK